MNGALAECQARLANIQSYRRHFLMTTNVTVTSSKTVDFSFRGPFGFRARTVLLAVESDSPSQHAFESVGGNVEVMGLIDFAEIRPLCTEITLAVHYEIKNRFFAWIDRHLRFVDAFLTAELRGVREYLDKVPARRREPALVFHGLQPATARA